MTQDDFECLERSRPPPMSIITFTVHGKAAPGGSKRAFVMPAQNGGKPRAVLTDANSNLKTWKQEVAAAAAPHVPTRLLTGAIEVCAVFYVPRPKGHFNSKGQLRPNAPNWPTKKPDATKLWRGTEDALTGVIWADDAQIVTQRVCKRFSPTGAPLTTIAIEEIP